MVHRMKLVILEEGTRSHLKFEGDRIQIGRAIDNDIRLAGQLASRHHCRIEFNPEGAWIVDLGSSNGTQVNGEKVKRQLLRSGDVLGVGGAKLTVEESEESKPREIHTRCSTSKSVLCTWKMSVRPSPL